MLATLHPGSERKTMNAVQNGAVHSGQIFSPLLVKIVPQRHAKRECLPRNFITHQVDD